MRKSMPMEQRGEKKMYKLKEEGKTDVRLCTTKHR